MPQSPLVMNPAHMINEVQANIREPDAIKLSLVLDCISDVDEKTQNRLFYELSRGEASFTIPLLNHLIVTQPDVAASLPVIRETLLSHLIAHPELLIDCLRDPAISNKTIFIQMAGDLHLDDATAAIINVLRETDDQDTAKLVVESLGAIGDPRSISTLTEFLYSSDRELTTAAVDALGQVGTPAAIQWLAERMGTDNELDVLILGVFGNVQDVTSVAKLNEMIRSQHTELRTRAKQELGRVGGKAVPVLVENLKEANVDLLIHTLNVLGDIGDASAIMPIRKLLSTESNNSNVRFAAYETLARLPLQKGAYALAAGLTDSEDHVCIAAARAIDRNLNDVLAAGLKNLVRADNDEARHIVKIIINAQVDRIFLSLSADQHFQDIVSFYLPHAHEDVRKHYTCLLRDNGQAQFAARIEANTNETGSDKQRQQICVVDDSRMILSIYKSTLHELGFEPMLFEFPASALEWLKRVKPAMVLTDLNMPKISGIELTERLRETYSADELPIIMVTTQSDVQDNSQAYEAGVNSILPKPFTAESLGAAMSKFVAVEMG